MGIPVALKEMTDTTSQDQLEGKQVKFVDDSLDVAIDRAYRVNNVGVFH